MIQSKLQVFAQSVVEYGALASATAAAQRSWYAMEDWFSRQGPSTWLAVGAVVLVVVVFLRVRNARS